MTPSTELGTERGHRAQGCNSFHVEDSTVGLTHKQHACRTVIPDRASGKREPGRRFKGEKLRSPNDPEDVKGTAERHGPNCAVNRNESLP